MSGGNPEALAAELAKFEPDEAIPVLIGMLASILASAGVLPGSAAYESAVAGCGAMLAASTLEANRGMLPLRHTKH